MGVPRMQHKKKSVHHPLGSQVLKQLKTLSADSAHSRYNDFTLNHLRSYSFPSWQNECHKTLNSTALRILSKCSIIITMIKIKESTGDTIELRWWKNWIRICLFVKQPGQRSMYRAGILRLCIDSLQKKDILLFLTADRPAVEPAPSPNLWRLEQFPHG